jgi:hypothetical protein
VSLTHLPAASGFNHDRDSIAPPPQSGDLIRARRSAERKAILAEYVDELSSPCLNLRGRVIHFGDNP